MTTAAQSAPVEQRAPGAHFVAHVPPQSMSLSSPSRIRSVHDGAHEPLVQMPLRQLVAPLQPAPNPHFAGQLPPQSTSVSSPSFNPFEQALAAHAPSRQIPLVQSRATAQAIPFAHLCGQLPPQSTPVSAPFRTPSPQVASRQVPRMQDRPAPQGLFASSQMEAGRSPRAAGGTRRRGCCGGSSQKANQKPAPAAAATAETTYSTVARDRLDSASLRRRASSVGETVPC